MIGKFVGNAAGYVVEEKSWGDGTGSMTHNNKNNETLKGIQVNYLEMPSRWSRGRYKSGSQQESCYLNHRSRKRHQE